MKLARFNDDRLGVVTEGGIRDVTDLLPASIMALRPRYRMNAVIAAFDDLRAAFERHDGPVLPLEEVSLDAPLTHPELTLCTFANYRQGGTHERAMPVFWLKPADAITGPGSSVSLPDMALGAVHHEAELVVIIGKGGRDITVEQALDHVFGYTATIDLNVRGILDDQGIAVNAHEGFGSLGPWIVTADELGSPQDLNVRLWQGETLRQDYSTSDMEYSVAELIAFVSGIATLEPGDLIACGTDMRGVGPVQHGETYRIEIDRIGGFTLSVTDPRRRVWPSDVDPKADEALQAARNGSFFMGANAFTPAIEEAVS
ncbi:fumarylacetoacetate hydrolase family protein [Novosphingobium pentaromativorans]|uniref:fumarylacetoacetate hydrolase family protein n=1 Tax=Novosphingobium pentaromativorans TaxID=205844 RepID=UPI001362E8EC|nr:fumarylacetoacetate hydrolase family protein [Novosphingobium pentaromativorans]